MVGNRVGQFFLKSCLEIRAVFIPNRRTGDTTSGARIIKHKLQLQLDIA